MFPIRCSSCVKSCSNRNKFQKNNKNESFYKTIWEGVSFPSEKYYRKKFQKNSVIIAVSVLYAKKEKIYPAYVSKYNSNPEKQVVFLMIPNRNRWNYLSV